MAKFSANTFRNCRCISKSATALKRRGGRVLSGIFCIASWKSFAESLHTKLLALISSSVVLKLVTAALLFCWHSRSKLNKKQQVLKMLFIHQECLCLKGPRRTTNFFFNIPKTHSTSLRTLSILSEKSFNLLTLSPICHITVYYWYFTYGMN